MISSCEELGILLLVQIPPATVSLNVAGNCSINFFLVDNFVDLMMPSIESFPVDNLDTKSRFFMLGIRQIFRSKAA